MIKISPTQQKLTWGYYFQEMKLFGRIFLGNLFSLFETFFPKICERASGRGKFGARELRGDAPITAPDWLMLRLVGPSFSI